MKRVAVFIWLTLLPGCVTDNAGTLPGQRIGYIEKNPIYRDRYDVYDARTGMRSGIYLEPNPIYKGQMDVKSNGNFSKGASSSKGGRSFKGGKGK